MGGERNISQAPDRGKVFMFRGIRRNPWCLLSLWGMLVLFLGGCSSTVVHDTFTIDELTDDGQEVKIVPQDVITYPGKVTLAQHPWDASSPIQGIKCDDKEIPFYYHQGAVKAYLTDSYFTKLPRHYVCFVTYTFKQQVKTKDLWHVTVHKFKYASERLQVDKKHIVLSPADQQRVALEQKKTAEVYRHGHPGPYFKTPFVRPLPSKITSYYGRKRIFNKGYRSQHLGTDFRAAIGTPIKNVNTGKVMLTDDLFYTGNTVIVDHGLGIFSVYGHLSEIQVEVGDIVLPGDIIGLSGDTGRVSGPHLHWGLKMQGLYTDGLSLVRAGI